METIIDNGVTLYQLGKLLTAFGFYIDYYFNPMDDTYYYQDTNGDIVEWSEEEMLEELAHHPHTMANPLEIKLILYKKNS